MELPLSGYLLKFWAEHSRFIDALRKQEGRDPLIINLQHIEAPDLLMDLVTLDTFQKRGGLFVYDSTTGKASINPTREYTKRDIENYLYHYLAVDDPSKLLDTLSKMQIDRPRKLKPRRNSTNRINTSNHNMEEFSNTNSSLNLGFKNNNEERGYYSMNKRNRNLVLNKSHTRRKVKK